MSVLLQFYIEKKHKNNEKILFWSCVLDSLLDLSSYKLSFLNTSLKIGNFKDFILQVKHKNYTQEILESEYNEYIKERPEIFLATDASMQRGSPYNHASSIMTTYYQLPESFIPYLRQFCIELTDYQFLKFQLQVISTIKNGIGIDIVKNESIPGCLSVYKRLPGFFVNGNFNALNGKTRYITITPDEDSFWDNGFVEIEIKDEKKILLRKLCKFVSNFYFELPSVGKLEHFSEFSISVYRSAEEKEEYDKMFEEHFHLLRSVHISGSIGGRNSKIVRNRFLQKTIDKVDIMHHQPFMSTLNKRDWTDWDRDYKDFLYGKKKKYIESLFFNKVTGRKDFLDWARRVISRGRKLTIVDPFFDPSGLQDFCTCIDTYMKIRILMKNPEKYWKEFKIDKDSHLSAIFKALPDTEIFFTDSIHDRYLIVEYDEKTVVYSLSNSWNGTVNNYSLYVQEMPLMPALQIMEEIENITINNSPFKNNFNTNKEKRKIKEKDKAVYTEQYISANIEKLKNINSNTDTDNFILVCKELFWAEYFTGIDKKEIIKLLTEKIDLFDKESILIMISKVVNELLKKQNEVIKQKEKFINEKPFSYYDTSEKCIKKIGLGNYFGTRYFDLDLDYALYELLKTLFFVFPLDVIEEVTEKEKNICVLIIGDKNNNEPFPYSCSEPMLCSFLVSKYPATIPLREDILNLINKVKKITYCRIFFAMTIIYHNREDKLSFIKITELLSVLDLTKEEYLILSADMYCKTSIQNRNQQNKIENEVFQNDIVKYVLNKYQGRDIIKFAYKAYIEPYELNFDGFKYFIGQLESMNRDNEILDIHKMLIICSTQTNSQLQNEIIKILDVSEYLLQDIVEHLDREKPDVIDSAKYHNFLPYIGNIFASFLKNDTQRNKFKKLHNFINVDKALVFPLYKFPKEAGLFYYEIAFLLSTILFSRKVDVNNRKDVFGLLDWYLPVCLNAHSNDFYGLSIQVIDLYTTLQSDETNIKLFKLVNSIRDKILIASSIKNQTYEYFELYKKVFKNFEVGGDKKDIIVLLNIMVNLCFRSAEMKNDDDIRNELLNILEQIKSIAVEKLDESVNKIIDAGMNYASSPSKETGKYFVEIMDKIYSPYSAQFLFEANNG